MLVCEGIIKICFKRTSHDTFFRYKSVANGGQLKKDFVKMKIRLRYSNKMGLSLDMLRLNWDGNQWEGDGDLLIE